MLRLVPALLLVAWIAGTAAYEWAALGWHPAREEPPGSSSWHWVRSLVTGVLAAVCVAAFARARAGMGSALEPRVMAGPLALLAPALAITALLAIDPDLYHAIARKDGGIE